jgi:hypothetical protein
MSLSTDAKIGPHEIVGLLGVFPAAWARSTESSMWPHALLLAEPLRK